jgi:hypothetical protein
MTICGLRLRDHIRLLTPLFALIGLVWALRWVLDSMGAPHTLVRMLSVTAATSLSVLIAVWLIHTRGVGSYPNVVMASLLLVVFEQALLVIAILISVYTGVENVFTEPEFSVNNDPNHVKHIMGHLTFGIGAGMLFGAATGCLMLWLLRRLVPRNHTVAQM